MDITDAEAAEFARLAKEELGISLTLDEAKEEGERFMQLMYFMFRHSSRSPP